MRNRRVVVFTLALGLMALIAAAAYWFTAYWVPRKLAAAVNDRFGDYVTVGAIRYVFPLSCEARDVIVESRRGFFLGGEAKRVKARLGVGELLKGHVDLRLLQAVTADDFVIYVYPIKKRNENRGAPPDRTGEPAATINAGEPLTTPKPISNAVALEPRNAGKVKEARTADKRPQKKKKATFDFSFAATGGRVIYRRGQGDTLLLTDVGLRGRISNAALTAAVSARAPKGGTVTGSLSHSFDARKGRADYNVEGINAGHVFTLTGKPKYVVAASGTIAMTGWVAWEGGSVHHRVTGRLSEGRLVLAPGDLQFTLDGVTLRFTVADTKFRLEEGTCRAAEVAWTFGGEVSDLSVNLWFRAERMSFQKLADMLVGGGKISYAGIGSVEFQLYGTPDQVDFGLRVERSDVSRN